MAPKFRVRKPARAAKPAAKKPKFVAKIDKKPAVFPAPVKGKAPGEPPVTNGSKARPSAMAMQHANANAAFKRAVAPGAKAPKAAPKPPIQRGPSGILSSGPSPMMGNFVPGGMPRQAGDVMPRMGGSVNGADSGNGRKLSRGRSY